MAGILNSKSRVIDAILTNEGRAKMALGKYSVAYVTFTDEGVAYIPDNVNGHCDPTGKIYLEARNLPQDIITFTANDDGKLNPLRNADMQLSNMGGTVPGLSSQANLINGKVEIHATIYGYAIKFASIKADSADNGKGFMYSDDVGVTAHIIIDSLLPAGQLKITLPTSPTNNGICTIGTMGGMNASMFASNVSAAMTQLSARPLCPNVKTNHQFETLYIESTKGSLANSNLKLIGILSSPLTLIEPALGGRIVSGEIDAPSFASQIEGILTSSFDNFAKGFMLSSVDRLFGDENFSLAYNDIKFNMDHISSKKLKIIQIKPPVNGLESLFQDRKLSHLPNFLYLPPIVKVSESNVGDKSKVKNLTNYLLGEYPSWGRNENPLTLEEIEEENATYGQGQQIPIRQSSRKNRIISQFFEISPDGSVNKLDVVESGTKRGKHVFFIGKTYLDNRGTPTFVNVFTLLLSSIPGESDLFT